MFGQQKGEKEMSDINMEIVENGIIVKISKKTERKDGGYDYKDETLVFPSLEDAQDWLSKNAPKKKIKDGLIEDVIAEEK